MTMHCVGRYADGATNRERGFRMRVILKVLKKDETVSVSSVLVERVLPHNN